MKNYMRAARIFKGLSQHDLGQMIGHTGSYVSLLERTRVGDRIKPELRRRISECLGVEEDNLFPKEQT
jgi:transcriptional regulator with XRE-family HTH domain